MRPLDLLLLLSLLLCLLWPILAARLPLPARWQRLLRLLPFASLVVAVLHLLLEQYRWQMVPAYLLTTLLSLNAFSALMHSGESRKPRVFALSDWLLWLVAVALPILLLACIAARYSWRMNGLASGWLASSAFQAPASRSTGDSSTSMP